MDRRTFLKRSGLAALLPLWARELQGEEKGVARDAKNAGARNAASARAGFRRRRPSDADWPSKAAWKRLNNAVDGNLIPVEFPIAACVNDVDSATCKSLITNIKNPYYIGDQPGLTQTLGWVDAWFTKPSVYAVAAKNAEHVAAAINFARENDLRLVVKGGGHSYQGTSNAADSLLVWTRHMHDIAMHDAFVPQGCESTHARQRAVTLGSGAIWMQAYDTVTTKGGAYVQGGGCTTVGVAGLVQSGGFGSFSKHYGTAAANLLEAEVVTADGKIRIANACTNPDLFWALKGGGGGSFGAVSKVTLRMHELPEFAGGAIFKIKAASDDAFRRLVRQFVGFYRENLFNEHWGESAHIRPENVLDITMVSYGLSTEDARKVWQPFLNWVARSPGAYAIEGQMILVSIPARYWWDVEWRKEQHQPVFVSDSRPGASANNVWWTGDGGQVGWTIYGYESLWLPASLLEDDSQERLANALFAGSRCQEIELHFNKGIAGGPREAIERTTDTAMNPAVVSAFALAIVGDAGGGYPGVRGHEPDVAAGRKSRERIHQCVNELRAITPNGGAYVSESNFFQEDWQQAYWGSNHARLAAVKKKYDPAGLFFVHNGVGSEEWSADGFTKL
ncbi:MAG: FAD-binding oxidoreductase [Candidatus Acidiferrales bacterium]